MLASSVASFLDEAPADSKLSRSRVFLHREQFSDACIHADYRLRVRESIDPYSEFKPSCKVENVAEKGQPSRRCHSELIQADALPLTIGALAPRCLPRCARNHRARESFCGSSGK